MVRESPVQHFHNIHSTIGNGSRVSCLRNISTPFIQQSTLVRESPMQHFNNIHSTIGNGSRVSCLRDISTPFIQQSTLVRESPARHFNNIHSTIGNGSRVSCTTFQQHSFNNRKGLRVSCLCDISTPFIQQSTLVRESPVRHFNNIHSTIGMGARVSCATFQQHSFRLLRSVMIRESHVRHFSNIYSTIDIGSRISCATFQQHSFNNRQCFASLLCNISTTFIQQSAMIHEFPVQHFNNMKSVNK